MRGRDCCVRVPNVTCRLGSHENQCAPRFLQAWHCAASKILDQNAQLASNCKTLAMLATCCAAPVGPEMRVARVKNSPEPAEHGLHLGAALAAATRRRLAFAPTFTFCPFTPRWRHGEEKQKTKKKQKRGAASNRRHSYGRVEPGTRTAPILGHRVVRVRWYPARFLKFCRRHGGEPHLPATGPTLRSGAGLDLGGVGGGGMPPPVTLAGPAELS